MQQNQAAGILATAVVITLLVVIFIRSPLRRAAKVLLNTALGFLVMQGLNYVGLGIAIKNNPKVLVRYGLILVGAAALCLVCYLLAKGEMAHGLSPTAPIPSAGELKFTDTILNLTYFTGAAAIVAIIFGEIIMAIRNK